MDYATPEAVGFDFAKLTHIRSRIGRYIDENKLSGVLTMIARQGKVVHMECMGMMNIEADRPMAEDVIFRIMSMTKPITSVAVMMLYEEGYFQLTDPIGRFIPEFKNMKVLTRMTENEPELADLQRDITIHDLLTHTAGLSYGIQPFSPTESMYQQANLFGADLKELVRLVSQIPLAAQPGTEWRYSISFDVLGYLVEVVSGRPFPVFLEERIFKPLGMKDTGFYAPTEKASRLARVYTRNENGTLFHFDEPWVAHTEMPLLPSGGGGLVSAASDYLRFTQMLLNHGEMDGVRLLGRKAVELLIMNHLPAALLPYKVVTSPPEYGYGYGLGVNVVVDVPQTGALGSVGAFAWGGAFNTFFFVDPQEELIGLIMTQFFPFGAYPLEQEFKTLVYQALAN